AVPINFLADTVTGSDTLRLSWAGGGSALLPIGVLASLSVKSLAVTSQSTSGSTGTALPTSLVVQVSDRYGNKGLFGSNAVTAMGTVSIASGPPGAVLGGTTRVNLV